jgi:hypothetical protein
MLEAESVLSTPTTNASPSTKGKPCRQATPAADEQHDLRRYLICDDSMAPRYLPGRHVIGVSATAPPWVGDDVVIELADGGMTMGELVSIGNDSMQLATLNPPRAFSVARSDVLRAFPVVCLMLTRMG